MGNAPVSNRPINIQVGLGNGLDNRARLESTNTLSPNFNTAINKCIDSDVNGNILEDWVEFRVKYNSQITLTEWCAKYNLSSDEIDGIQTEIRAGLGIIPMRDNKTLMGSINPGTNMRENMTKAIGTIIQVSSSSVDGESSNEIEAAVQLATPYLEAYNNSLWSQGIEGNIEENDIMNPSSKSIELPSSTLNDTIDELIIKDKNIKIENRMLKALAVGGLVKRGSDLVSSLFGKASRPRMATIPALGYRDVNMRVPVSNSDALNSGTKMLPVNTVIDALTTVFRASGLAEKHFSTCKGALLAATSSSPSVKINPGSTNAKLVWDNLTNEEKKVNCEVCSVAGGTFGLQTAIGNGPMTMNSDLNVIQKVADTVTIGNGITLTDVSRNKELFKRLDRISTEVLVAKPLNIQSYEVPQSIWITNIDFFESFSASRMSELKYDSSFFVNPKTASGRLTSPIKLQETTDRPEKSEVDMVFALPDIYTLDSVYEDYEATCVFVLSLYSEDASLRPGLLLSVLGVEKPVFVSAVKQPDSSGLWRASISTSLLSSLDLFGGKGAIGFCVVGKSVSCSLSVLSASTNLIRRTVSSRVGHWVFNRKKADSNVLSYMFTVNPLVQISSSPLDVVNLWMEFISAYTPFVSSILFKIRDPKFSLAVKAIQLFLINGGANEKSKFASVESVKSWMESALLDMPNWMIFRGNAPFYAIKHECIPQICWKLLAFSYGAAMANIYEMGGNSSSLSALPTISELSHLTPKIPIMPASINISRNNVTPMIVNNRRVRDVDIVPDNDPVIAFGESHLRDVLIMAGQAY